MMKVQNSDSELLSKRTAVWKKNINIHLKRKKSNFGLLRILQQTAGNTSIDNSFWNNSSTYAEKNHQKH